MSHQRDWTHCKHGHPFDETNTYVTPGGERVCRQCSRDGKTRRRQRTRKLKWHEQPMTVDNGIAHIPLRNGQTHALIDAADLPLVLGPRMWQLHNGYASTTLPDKRRLYMHRIILDPGAGLHTDHINRNKLDNRRANLRAATHTQNVFNVSLRSNNTSGYKGVSRTRSGMWGAWIRVRGRSVSLGTFTSKELAAEAYDKAAADVASEFAYLNFEQSSL